MNEVTPGSCSGHTWSLDVWYVGCLIYELFNGPFTKIEQIKTKGNIPESLFAYGEAVTCDGHHMAAVAHPQRTPRICFALVW